MKTVQKTPVEAWLAGLAMLGVMLLGMWQALLALGSPAMQSLPLNLLAFEDGRLTAAFGSQLDKNLPLRSALIGWANAGRYLFTQGAGDQVRLGRDGWLFSVEETQFFEQAQAHQQQRVAMMATLVHALKSQGVAAVVALVPDKAREQAAQTWRGHYPAWYADRYDSLLASLGAAGVETVNLLPVLRPTATESFYYRTDTHWNQRGAERAARAVALRVKTWLSASEPVAFVTEVQGPAAPRPGDLLHMMGLADMPDALRPVPDVERPVVTRRLSPAQATGLFGSAAVPVVLVGTSYSMRANFHGYLQQALGSEVLDVARDGGGFARSMQDYLADDAFRSAPPQVIVWEVPERVFSPPLSAAEIKGWPLIGR